MLSRFAVAVVLVVGGSSFACVANQQKNKTTLVCESRAITGSHVERPVCVEKTRVQDRQEDDQREMKRNQDRTPRTGNRQ